jgi:zinc transporter ZupT
LFPVAVLLFAAFGTSTSAILWWSVIACAATLGWWIAVYAAIGENPLYALAYPLGALIILYIFVTAVTRGRRVSWKGRTYISG